MCTALKNNREGGFITTVGIAPVTVRECKQIDTRPDPVKRNFQAAKPNLIRVADVTHVRTSWGFGEAAFDTDVFSREIVGWALSDSMRAEMLPLRALD